MRRGDLMAGLRIIRDADTAIFTIGSDRLELLASPRVRDVEAVREVEQREAFDKLKMLKDIYGDDFVRQAEEQAARERSADPDEPDTEVSPLVREARLRALGVKLVVAGQAYGGEAIIEAYRNMSAESAAWVDGRVDEVWRRGQVTDAEREGEGADEDDALISAS